MKALAIAATDLRRLLRWRANIFFVFVLPMLIILLLGAAFGGANKALSGSSTPIAASLHSSWRPRCAPASRPT